MEMKYFLGLCMMCHQITDVRHIDLYPAGSEGLFCCRSCEDEILDFVKQKGREIIRKAIEKKRKEMINNDNTRRRLKKSR